MSVVRVGEEKLLLGISADGIQLISKLNSSISSVRESVRAAASSPMTLPQGGGGAEEKKGKPGEKIRFQISDNGVQSMTESGKSTKTKNVVINNINKLIREKLETLPKSSRT